MKTFLNIDALISSYWGMYAVQTVLHSVIASVLVDCALLAWNVRSPRVKQQFRFMVLFLPVVSFPVYQLINPDRGSIYFRMEALFDVNRWLSIELWGKIPLGFFL